MPRKRYSAEEGSHLRTFISSVVHICSVVKRLPSINKTYNYILNAGIMSLSSTFMVQSIIDLLSCQGIVML